MTEGHKILWEGTQSKEDRIHRERAGVVCWLYGIVPIFIGCLLIGMVIPAGLFIKTTIGGIIMIFITCLIILFFVLSCLVYYYKIIPSFVEKYNPVAHYILTSEQVIKEGWTLRGKKRIEAYNLQEIKYVVILEDGIILLKELDEKNKKMLRELSQDLHGIIYTLVLCGSGITFTGIEESFDELVEVIHSKLSLEKYELTEGEEPNFTLYMRA